MKREDLLSEQALHIEHYVYACHRLDNLVLNNLILRLKQSGSVNLIQIYTVVTDLWLASKQSTLQEQGRIVFKTLTESLRR